jgi:hypothetical protein
MFDCETEAVHDGGDHDPDGHPLVYDRGKYSNVGA